MKRTFNDTINIPEEFNNHTVDTNRGNSLIQQMNQQQFIHPQAQNTIQPVTNQSYVSNNYNENLNLTEEFNILKTSLNPSNLLDDLFDPKLINDTDYKPNDERPETPYWLKVLRSQEEMVPEIEPQAPIPEQLVTASPTTVNLLNTEVDSSINKHDNGSANLELIAAVKDKNYHLLNFLIESGVNPITSSTNNALQVAIMENDYQATQILLKHFPYLINITSTRGRRTPLEIACANTLKRNEDLRFVELLIQNGADVNTKISRGVRNSLLHNAVEDRKPGLIQLLLKHNANINAQNLLGQTPLHIAATLSARFVRIPYEQIMHYLIYTQKTNLAIKDNQGNTCLHLATCNYGIHQLIQAGANINAVNNSGETPLHYYARNETVNIETIALFFKHNEHSIDVSITSAIGTTPLHIAAKYGILSTIKYFIKKNANIFAADHNNQLPLHIACMQNNPQSHLIIASLSSVNGFNINARTNTGCTPLLLAACYSNGNAVLHLIQSGSDLTAIDNLGNNVLHYAAQNPRHQALETLLANINQAVLTNLTSAQNNEGYSPIIISYMNGISNNQRLFERAGARLPLRLLQQQSIGEINKAQSTHEVSVHVSVAKSTQALMEHYKNCNLQEAITKLMSWGTTIPETDLINKSAKKALARIRTYNFTDKRANVTMQQLLGLVYLAINDLNYVEDIKSKTLEEQYQIIDDRFKLLIHSLYETQRGYNLNNVGVDNNNTKDSPICVPGNFNKIVESLSAFHPKVCIKFVTAETIKFKVKPLVNELFMTLSDSDKTKYCSLWTEDDGMPDELLDILAPMVSQKLHEEFDEFAAEVEDYATHMKQIIENLGYMTPPPSVINWPNELKAKNEKSNPDKNGYTPGFFKPLENEALDVLNNNNSNNPI